VLREAELVHGEQDGQRRRRGQVHQLGKLELYEVIGVRGQALGHGRCQGGIREAAAHGGRQQRKGVVGRVRLASHVMHGGEIGRQLAEGALVTGIEKGEQRHVVAAGDAAQQLPPTRARRTHAWARQLGGDPEEPKARVHAATAR
jgi:hypothetical protein